MNNSTAWNEIFTKRGKVFNEPHEDLGKIIDILKRANAQKILDLGCGSGRHTVALAKAGFSVFGIDNAQSGLDLTKEWLDAEKLSAVLKKQEMTDAYTWKDESFDAVISVQVIHHADVANIKKIIKEISRILRPTGLIFITVPKLKNQGENFKEIEPNTYIPLDGKEKGLPHHYFTPDELKEFFHEFEIQDIHVDSHNHYCLIAYKKNKTANNSV